MAIQWLKSWLSWFEPAWPPEIPRLYPELNTTQLCSFLSEEEYVHLKKLRPVLILPLASGAIDDKDYHFRVAMSRMLIRDLMLVPTLSIRGEEDTPTNPAESIDECSFSTDRHT